MAAAVASGGDDLRSSARVQKKSRKNKGNARLPNGLVDEIPLKDCDAKGEAMCARCTGGYCAAEEADDVGFRSADWGDAMESQLRELLLGCLDAVYKDAVKRIAACGYSEEAATNAVLMSGVSSRREEGGGGGRNVLGDALSALRDGGCDAHPKQQRPPFDSLGEMERHVLEEMVSVLREARPFFSTGDAMWCLLVCDMDMQRAFGIHLDPYIEEIRWPSPTLQAEEQDCGSGRGGAGFGDLPGCKNLEQLAPSIEGVLQSMIGIPDLPCQKSGGSLAAVVKSGETQLSPHTESLLSQVNKCQSGRSKRDSILRQKYFHIEKTYQMYGPKGAVRTGRLGNLGSLISDKKCRSFSDPTGINMKSAMVKIGKTIRSNVSQGDGGVPMLSIGGGLHACPHGKTDKCSSSSSSSAANNEIPSSPSSETGDASSDSVKLKNTSSANVAKDSGVEKTVADDMVGKCIPHDHKDEVLLKLSQHMHELQIQLDEWKKWAEQKVVQAAQRLRKDKAEIQILRQAKDEVGKLNKEKETLEQNTLKKFTEMENAIAKAGNQVAWASGAKCRLEIENAELRLEMEAAKLRALKSVDSYHEASKRETEILKKMQSWDRQKPVLQEEVMIEKRKLSELQEKLNQAVKCQHQLEASLRQEEKLKDEVLMHANSIAKKREVLETSAKSHEDLIRCSADEHLKRHTHILQKLKEQIDWVRRNACPPNMVAPSWSVDGGKVSGVVNMYNFSVLSLQESECGYHVPPECECVMCLMEEKSVLFLPCAHQVVCINCNTIHEKQGMKDCPSCRTPIQRRIPVRYASSRAENMRKSGASFKKLNSL